MDLRMPAFFPTIVEGCEEVSSKFFDCFDSNCEPWGSQKAAEEAMVKCKDLMKDYEKCTVVKLSQGPKPSFLTAYDKS